MTTKKQLVQYRSGIYNRNVKFVRDYKEAKGCEECEQHYPHYILDTIPSIARLAGSRCKLDHIKEALKTSKIVCANCRRIIEWKERNKE